MKKVQELLSNQGENYLFPFFWQHGESKEVIIDYMNQMLSKGIKAACVESRPHPDFLGNGWWETMDVIINHAKKVGMKLWILDDARFPTGYANGKVPNHLKKVYLDIRKFDVIGPATQAQLNLNYVQGRNAIFNPDKHAFYDIKSVSLVRKRKDSSLDEHTLIDLTSQLNDNILTFDLPVGHFSVYVVFKTNARGEEQTKDYLNPLDVNATKILIDEVYEKHYAHYKEEFGSTIVGFFSDEPRFGNAKGFESIIGRSNMVLPYVDGIESYMSSKVSGFTINDWIYAFIGDHLRAHQIRQAYMDVVSSLYRDRFSKVIGAWCKEHGVDYTGHTIEDNNAHARLGYGAAHYFRGLEGQSITGIDIIGGQVVPGMDYHHDAFLTGGSDGEFYHYALCKLGASSAKLDKNKNGVLMCEAFGAYGWSEGLKMMKWITDHMISRGVNLIVPHAFSPKEFPDWDCPPHFYAHGNNPQFEYFELWSNYANRLCHLFSGGSNVTTIGVLYHGFAEWAGEAMLVQKPMKVLTNHQIDADIISEDFLLECSVRQDEIEINGHNYDTLIVPYTQYMSKEIAEKLIALSKHGVKVITLEQYPKAIFNCDLLQEFSELVECIPMNNLVERIKMMTLVNVETQKPVANLVASRYRQDDGDVFMFFNESVSDMVDVWVQLKTTQPLAQYDAMTNELKPVELVLYDSAVHVHIVLNPYESIILVNKKIVEYEELELLDTMEVNNDWFVDVIPYTSKEVNQTIQLEKLEYLTHQLPDFSGKLVYRKQFKTHHEIITLQIDNAIETVSVYNNGSFCGTRICPPYDFDLSKSIRKGENQLEVHVVNTLGRSQKDFFSHYLVLEPVGIASSVKISAFARKALKD